MRALSPSSSCSSEQDEDNHHDESFVDGDESAASGAEDGSDPSEDDEEEADEFVKREATTAIRAARGLVLGALVVAGALVASSVYLLTAQNLEQDEKAGASVAIRRVSGALAERVAGVLGGMDLLATDIQLQVQDRNESWPLVTVPYFEARASRVRFMHEMDMLALLPVVGEKSRVAWHNFSVTYQDEWVKESIQYISHYQEPIVTNEMSGVVAHVACGRDGLVNMSSSAKLALWQVSPPLTEGSFDPCTVSKDQSKVLSQVLASGMVALGVSYGENRDDSRGEDRFDARVGPRLTVAYPLLDRESSAVVAVLLGALPWNHLLRNIFVDGEHALTSVSSASDERMLFGVDGRGVSYLGVAQGKGGQAVNESQWWTKMLGHQWNERSDVVPIEDLAATFMVEIDWDAASSTVSPTLYAIIVILFFAICIFFFLVYDHLVHRRQENVMEQAKRHFRIVKSLFPARVRDRLLEQQDRDVYPESPRPARTASETRSTKAASEFGDRASVRDLEHGRDASESSDETRMAENTSISPSPTKSTREPPKRRLRSFLRDRENFSGFTREDDSCSVMTSTPVEQKPIADLFPACTVLFADIAGFTAWSSERDPTQVFLLLGAIYSAFDKAARRRKVFKVETIGDSYVAVTGLPDPQADHAWIMCQFALDCRTKMREVTRKLERTLGPETGDLDMRFGLHSGAVTAGVLVGERARFQLFGDTVNTASRMESTGMRNCIQVSEVTATLLGECGKGHWLIKREGTVSVKGKGEMQTYWLEPREESSPRRRLSLISESSSEDAPSSAPAPVMLMPDLGFGGAPNRGMLQAQKCTTVWGTSEVFDTMPPALTRSRGPASARALSGSTAEANLTIPPGRRALDEVVEVIDLPTFDPSCAAASVVEDVDTDAVELDEEIETELRDYVTAIASMYRDNFFHNFEHACHVQMSMIKLLQRVVTPEDIDEEGEQSTQDGYTYGTIASDPLTQFSVVFAALIHDVDHCGVANGQLIKENSPIATYYDGKSVAEQNSIDLAWELLMDPKFDSLRGCIYANEAELRRFRQLVVNVVLATDIFDKELGALRKVRWAKAFGADEAPSSLEPSATAIEALHRDQVNRKATIVIEHLIQASDVSHTMQHWDIYRKWNKLLFFEMYSAYRSGRTDSDPSAGWYQGEIWFFDNYVIPLAAKLRECGVFGVSSDECLSYARENRRLWEENGEAIVREMLETDYITRLRRKPQRAKRRVRNKKHILDDGSLH